MVAFDSTVTPISEIPFPAFTVCNYNKVRKSRVEHLEQKMEEEPNNKLWQTEHLFIEEVCSSHLDHGEHEDEDGDLEIDGHLLHDFLEELSQPCDSLALRSADYCHFCQNTGEPEITLYNTGIC